MNTRRVHPVPASTSPRELGFAMQRPMRHVTPRMILRQIVQAAVASITSIEPERRDLVGQPLPEYAHPELSYLEHAQLWLDFVADTGDGFNATYTVARLVAEPRLEVGGAATQRGSLLVLGGDLCYPEPGHVAYRDHLVGPYRAALPVEDALAAPDAVALPGDYDWGDGLAGFRTTFAQGGWLGGWRLRQTRSYIAIALPHRYWLWGIDGKLGVDVEPQRKYFQDAARKLGRGDRVILCSHHPLWLQIAGGDLDQLQFVTDLVEERGAELVLQLSGKRHYYAPYRVTEVPAREPGDRHALICGGGGAFVDDSGEAPEVATVPLRETSLELVRGECFPTEAQSRVLTGAGLARFPARATWIGAINVMFWSFALHASNLPSAVPAPIDWSAALWDIVKRPGMIQAALIAWLVALLLARHGRMPFRLGLALGTLHALAHLGAVAALTVLVAAWIREAWQQWAILLAVFSVSGPVVTVLYFAVARLLGQHRHEVVPILGVEDWKSFVRLHIDTDGTLRIYPIGIAQVPTSWQLRRGGDRGAPWLEPGAGAPSARELASLIHAPIVIPPNAAQRAALAAPRTCVREPPYDVFVSYSRADAAWVRAFLDALAARAAADGLTELRVFVDTESLRLREFWRTRILDEISRCHCFVAIWTPAYVAAWEAGRMCFAEYEHARTLELRDPELVFEVYAGEAALPYPERHLAHFTNVAREELAASREFEKLYAGLAARIRARRAAG